MSIYLSIYLSIFISIKYQKTTSKLMKAFELFSLILLHLCSSDVNSDANPKERKLNEMKHLKKYEGA